MQQGLRCKGRNGGERHRLVKVDVDGSYDVWNSDFCGHGSGMESRTREGEYSHMRA